MEILKTEKLYDGRWLKMYVSSFRNKAGKTMEWTFASRNENPSVKKCNAVIIVPIIKDQNKIVMIKEFRIPLQDHEYGFPAGLIDEGEDYSETIRRELKEETGLELEEIVEVSPPIFSSAGLTDECVRMAYVYCKGDASSEHNESSEKIDSLVLDYDQMVELFRSEGKKFGAKAWTVLYMFYKQGGFKL